MNKRNSFQKTIDRGSLEYFHLLLSVCGTIRKAAKFLIG